MQAPGKNRWRQRRQHKEGTNRRNNRGREKQAKAVEENRRPPESQSRSPTQQPAGNGPGGLRRHEPGGATGEGGGPQGKDQSGRKSRPTKETTCQQKKMTTLAPKGEREQGVRNETNRGNSAPAEGPKRRRPKGGGREWAAKGDGEERNHQRAQRGNDSQSGRGRGKDSSEEHRGGETSAQTQHARSTRGRRGEAGQGASDRAKPEPSG